MDERVTIVGLAPSSALPAGVPPFAAARGGSGRRLAALAGVTSVAAVAETRNLFDVPVGAGALPRELLVGQGHCRPLPEGAVVLLGRQVATAYGYERLAPLIWHRRAGRRVAVLPHPSGRNRWWNDARNSARAALFLRRTLGLAPDAAPA
jgi:uracil-DNA glycosylase